MHRLVDRRNDHLHERHEIGKRPIAVGRMTLKCEVGAIKLQQKSIAYDRLVFDLQRVGERIEITLEGIVMLVLHDRRDDPGRGRGQECFGEALLARQRRTEIGAFGHDQ